MRKAEETFEAMYDLIAPRLNQVGPICSNDAWELCKHRFGYSNSVDAFRKIMNVMVEQGKATLVRKGKWNILKPNERL